MHDALGEELQVHGLVELLDGIQLVERLAVELLQLGVAFLEAAGVPGADDGVHGVVRAAAVHADPLDLHFRAPGVEVRTRAGMHHEVADLVAGLLVPRIAVVAGIDDQDVALLHLDLVGDHLRRVDGIVGDLLGDVHDDAGADPFAQRHVADRAAGGIEVDFTVHVGADVVGGGDDLAVGALAHVGAGEALEVLDAQRHVRRPRRRVHAEAHRQVEHLRVVQEVDELLGVHVGSFCWLFTI